VIALKRVSELGYGVLVANLNGAETMNPGFWYDNVNAIVPAMAEENNSSIPTVYLNLASREETMLNTEDRPCELETKEMRKSILE